MEIDKHALLGDLITQAEAELASLVRAARNTHEAATHEEAKPENDKDTRGLEASYLASGQAERVRELERTVQLLRALPVRDFASGAPIALGAVVHVVTENREVICLVARGAGGMTSSLATIAVQVVTPESPLGRALIGQMEGDEIEVLTGRGKRLYEIIRVR